jgi:hypothetical protein
MLIFDRFVLPEHPEISYQLADGLNHINIKRGDDDTFLNHPKGCFLGTTIPDDIPDWVIYHGHYRDFKLLGGGSKCPFPVEDDLESIEDNISVGLQKMLKLTVEGRDTKFSFHVSSSDQIVARISEDHHIEMYRTQDGRYISHCFQAHSEKHKLDFAISYASRCHYGNPPFVVFRTSRRHPASWQYHSEIIEFVEQMPNQVIIVTIHDN